mgnify:CR=1 FL=1
MLKKYAAGNKEARMDVFITAASCDEIHLGRQRFQTISTQTVDNNQTASTQTLHNQKPTSTQTPPKFPPIGLKLIRELETDNFHYAVCHYDGYTYVGQSGGAIDRIDQNGRVDKAFIKQGNHHFVSIAAQKDMLYNLMFVSKLKPLKINIHNINDGKPVATWDHPYYQYVGQRIILLGNDQLCIGDYTSKQIIIYSLIGEVFRKVPCSPPLTMTADVSVTSCAANSVVISDMRSDNIVRMSLEDGRLLWSFDGIEHPSGIFYHQAGYVFVVNSYNNHTIISVLNETDGKLFCFMIIIIIKA